MIKFKRKGFTMIELIIVIVVVAILAAVLIPTFTGLINAANISADIQLVTSLNKILAAEAALEGKNGTMTDALADAKENGYDVLKLTPTSKGNDIVWNQEDDSFYLIQQSDGRIVYRNGSKTTTESIAEGTEYKYWKIYDEMPAEQKYSIYWDSNATPQTVNVGFDAGEKYTGMIEYVCTDTARNIVIRSNSGGVTLNGYSSDESHDTIYHYGRASGVILNGGENTELRECGIVGYVEIESGNCHVENSASVRALFVNSQDAQANNENGIIRLAYAANEVIRVNHKGNVKLERIDKSGTIDTIKSVATLCEEGLGTKDDPFVIGQQTFEKLGRLDSTPIDDLYTGENKPTRRYYKLAEDIDFSKIDWTNTNQQQRVSVNDADFDLNGHTIKNLDCPFIAAESYLNIHDGSIEFEGNATLLNCWLMVYAQNSSKTVIVKNVKLYGSTTNNSVIALALVGVNVTLENVTSEVDVKADSAKDLVGGLIGGAVNSTIHMKNCLVSADITAEKDGASAAGMINGTGCTVTVENCSYRGTIKVKDTSKAYYCSPAVSAEINEACRGGASIEALN